MPINFYSLPYPANVAAYKLENAEPAEFRIALIAIPAGVYEVEQIASGQTVCIEKPGGKGEHDFMVYLCNAEKTGAWRISHEAMKKDIQRKIAANCTEARRVITAMRQVCEGDDPDATLRANVQLGTGLPGLPVEAILKTYKWIWGQEDCNYPPPNKGRFMSLVGLEKCLS